MASVPCKRFDFAPRCLDGRGGWTFSQFGADRYGAQLSDLAIKMGLAVWVTPAVPDQYVEYSKLIAVAGGAEIGSDVLEWKHPNDGGANHSDGTVFEWIQDVDCPVDGDTLIEVSIHLKLNCEDEYLPVHGNAFVHVTSKDTNDELITPDDYIKSLHDPKSSWSW